VQRDEHGGRPNDTGRLGQNQRALKDEPTEDRADPKAHEQEERRRGFSENKD